MEEYKIVNSSFIKILSLSMAAGLFPLLLYPFSAYYGLENQYADFNHGPLHQFPAGDYFTAAPSGVDYLIDISFGWPPFLMLLISLFLVLYYIFTRRFMIGLSYLIPAAINFLLLYLQIFILYWLFD